MHKQAPSSLPVDTWHRSTYSFGPGVPVKSTDDAVLDRTIEIRYLVMKITRTRTWYDQLDWIQSFAPDEVMQIEPMDVRGSIVLVAYAVTNHEQITLDECNYLFEAMRVLPSERHFPKTQSCAIMIGLSIFEDMEEALGCQPIED